MPRNYHFHILVFTIFSFASFALGVGEEVEMLDEDKLEFFELYMTFPLLPRSFLIYSRISHVENGLRVFELKLRRRP